jgi:proteasome alpha subunit
MFPFAVQDPEEFQNSRANFCDAVVGKGKNIVSLCYDKGIVVLSENPYLPNKLKIDELYDRLIITGVGEPASYDEIRLAATRYADLKGMQYDAEDVKGEGVIRDVISPFLRTTFNNPGMQPKRVKFLLAELLAGGAYFCEVRYDGETYPRSSSQMFAAIGKHEEEIEAVLSDWAKKRDFTKISIDDAIIFGLKAIEEALGSDSKGLSEFQTNVASRSLEIAVLDRSRDCRRKFRRVDASGLDISL